LKKVLGDRTIDVYYDNVGGETLEAVLSDISVGARIVLCGAISQYNEGHDGGLGGELKSGPGARNYAQLISRRGSMHGFIVTDYANRFAEARRELSSWLASGHILPRETLVHGLEQVPDALRGLFHGKNVGKVVVEVAKPIRGESDKTLSHT
jgi:NADPH-dependent curcumin reductase